MESVAELFKQFYYEDGNTNATNMDGVLSLLRTSSSTSSWKTTEELIENIDLSASSSTTGAAYFTIAALLFHNHQYRDCMKVIEVMMIHCKEDECSGDALCYKICFLGMEALLQLFFLSGTTGTDSDKDNFYRTFHTYVNFVNKRSSSMEGGFLKSWLTYRLQLYQCRCLIAVNNLKHAKKEIKNALGIFQDIRISDDVASAKGMSYFGCPLTPIDRQNQIALYIKASLEYYRKNYRKSLKLLENCRPKEGEDAVPFNNNIGCIYFKLQRYHASLLYFQRSLQYSNPRIQSQNLVNSYVADLAYNIGLTLLVMELPEEASKYFYACSDHFSDRPHLWVRLAECYLRCHQASCSQHAARYQLESISSGASKRIVIRPVIEASREKDATGNDNDNRNQHHLLFAKNCVIKCLDLIQQRRTAEVTNSNDENSHQNSKGSYINGDENGSFTGKDESEIGGEESMFILGLDVLEETCMVMLIYIAMECVDYIQGIKLCTDLIKKDRISEKSRFLVELMLCEALCLSGKMQEAKDHLESTISSQESFSLFSVSSAASLGLNDVSDDLKVTMITSLYRAIYLIHAGRLQEAQPMLEKLFNSVPENQYVVKALLYCHLRCRTELDSALKILRSKRTF